MSRVKGSRSGDVQACFQLEEFALRNKANKETEVDSRSKLYSSFFSAI